MKSMAGETRDERSSNESTSIAPKLSGGPHPQVKAKPNAGRAITQHPVFIYSHNMISPELIANIDEKWDACWPMSILKPLVLLDLISYLLFVKELEEKQLLTKKLIDTFNNLTHSKEKSEASWADFKDLDAQSMHNLFTKDRGIPHLVKNYSQANLRYSLFVKEPLLLTPTAAMLSNMVEIIRIMEAENSDTRASIFEYLINKSEITASNGQVYAPDYVVKLVVALMQPSPEDMIGDPSAGNGSFLVNSAMYIANKNSAAIPDFKNDVVANMYKGIESDLIQLRIGAMNMILHGIEDPKLESLNVLSKTNLNIREQPTLILSNLFFESVEDKALGGTSTPKTETRRQEIRFLNFILKSLKSAGRSAVIVRELVLYDNITEIKTIRQQIIDDHKLEAVISLPGRADSQFSGACVLIFTKPATNVTDKVWFYKMETGKQLNKKATDTDAGKNDVLLTEEYEDMADIISRWKNEKEESLRKRTDKSFYVPVDEIRSNNYNLSYNEYRKIVKDPEQDFTRGEESVPSKQEPVPRKQEPVSSKQEPIPSKQEPISYKAGPVPYKEIASQNIDPKKASPYIGKIKLPPMALSPKGKFPKILVSILIICVVLVFYFIFSNNSPKKAIFTPAGKNDSSLRANTRQSTDASTKKTPAKENLSSEQIKKILKDTTGIIHFQKQAGLPVDVKDSEKSMAKSNAPAAGKTVTPLTTGNISKVQYTVLDTTYFHDKPDGSTHRKSYLNPLNHNILTPIREQNGFIFIVYTNRFGVTSKGWINKKDLKTVR